MTPKEIIENLTYINKWRRDSTGKIEQPQPYVVGETIDEAIKYIKKQLKQKTI